MKYWVVVPAAGTGKRFGSETPKQYLSLLGKTIMQHTLDRLASLPMIERLIVPIAAQDEVAAKLVLQYPEKIQFVVGGSERMDSVLAGLQALTTAQADDWVLVHDVARPCVRLADIESLITTLAEDAVGGILGHPVRDTIKQSSASSTTTTRIETTVPRQRLWQAFTPQMFRYQLLKNALEHAVNQHILVTDEASAVEVLGYQPQLVQGSLDNLKITFPDDLPLAAYFLSQQSLS